MEPRLLTNSLYEGTCEVPLIESTIGSLLASAAALVPQQVAIVDGIADVGRRRLTYEQLFQKSQWIARCVEFELKMVLFSFNFLISFFFLFSLFFFFLLFLFFPFFQITDPIF